MVTAMMAMAMVGMAIVQAQAQDPPYGQCPTVEVDKMPLQGTWTGYQLSTVTGINATNRAELKVVFDVKGNDTITPAITATVTLSSPFCSGSQCNSTKVAPLSECVTVYDVVCLTMGHPNVFGFHVKQAPSCLKEPSDWKCHYALTSTDYQDLGHPAAFYASFRYDKTDPTGFPLRGSPFGTFYTGCPKSSVESKLEMRLINHN
jgi:hypothetical protein